MRTPNASCLLCGKPLYRRPFEMAKVRYAACLAHRSEAQKVAGITDAQQAGLALSRKKGFNYRNGRKDTPETKAKRAVTLKLFHAANPLIAIERGKKIQGENNYRWKGGASKMNTSIRQMSEYRKWMDGVKARDGKCVRCGSIDNLESHHEPSLSSILDDLGIKTREDARMMPQLWDIRCGITLCEACHYAEHGRHLAMPGSRKSLFIKCSECHSSFKARPSRSTRRFCCPSCAKAWRIKNPLIGPDNPNWKGGLKSKHCVKCDAEFSQKPLA